jgi:hypothetical protein
MTPDNRRRRYWINPRFQGNYVSTILGLQLVTALVTALVTMGLAFGLISPAFEAGPSWTAIFIVFIVMLTGVGLALIWLGVRVSHRICGPVYRIEQTLRALREGRETGPIKLREGDQFQDLAESINQALRLMDVKASREDKDSGPAEPHS